ncbi:response regulator receiver domain [Pseudomonas aeruginosa]|uniref:response regulator receiver domain n=1 Tax=Pseudomonas aeruginosa TaxID=287 RepID=UPI002767FEFE|nr:response regulator receiver domain [Pseudomonas aeruginosa]HCF7185721.1 hypothetical protein [Pseudomonas aeruginosa]
MTSQQTVTQSPEQIWVGHVRKAVRRFLKTAVVVDNEPGLSREPVKVAEIALPADAWSDNSDYKAASPDVAGKSPEANVLDIRKISDSFAEQDMVCAFVLPENSDDEVEKIKSRVVSAARSADILVMDWQLKPGSSGLTLKILREIAESDASENGRMRLICIYTGEVLDDHVFSQAKEHLAVSGVDYKDVRGVSGFPYLAKSANSLLVLANKDDIPADELPSKLVDVFSKLPDGIIPAFALAAIGAVRKNTHHMLTRFSSSLDVAYVANRLITNPPGDVAELMRELLVAECDNAIGLDSVADEFLEPSAISSWLDVRGMSPFSYYTGDGPSRKGVLFDRNSIDALLKNGINDHGIKISNSVKQEFSEGDRGLISYSLAGSVESSHRAENEFSRLVAFRREAFGGSINYLADGWLPSLTTGTLLKLSAPTGDRYFLCFTPACDTLRLNGPRPFVFLEGVGQAKPYNLVALDETGEVGLYFNKSYPQVATFSFKPDKKLKRVRAQKIREQDGVEKYIFSPVHDTQQKLVWLGEVRYGRAMSEMAELVSRWMRVGILDSEHLRLAGRKNFTFMK